MITKISDLYKIAEERKDTKRLALAVAHDHHALDAVYKASKKDIIIPILVGDKTELDKLAHKHNYDLSGFEIHDISDKQEAVCKAVSLVSEGKADIVMKGNVGTATFLKGILNEKFGLRTNKILSHFSIFELKEYHKLISITDVAMNIAPNLKEKIGILNNAVNYMNRIGIKTPKVAVLGAVETVSEKMPATIDASIMSKMNQRKQITNCIVDGPLAFDNAMSKESAEHKGIVSDVAGDADLLFVPAIEAGNVLYKAFAFSGAKLAAVILGAKAPVVLTSRSDSEESKLNSIVLAAVS